MSNEQVDLFAPKYGWRAKVTPGTKEAYCALVLHSPDGTEVGGIDLDGAYNERDPLPFPVFARIERTTYLAQAIARFFNAGGTPEDLNDVVADIVDSYDKVTDSLELLDTETWQPLATIQQVDEPQHFYFNAGTRQVLFFQEDGFVEFITPEEFNDLLTVSSGDMKARQGL